MYIYKKSIPIYFGQLIIVVNNDFNESFKKFNFNFGEFENCVGLAHHSEAGGKSKFYIFLGENPSHSTIAHESLHITHYLLKEACHKPDYDNDETECYLLDYIVGEVYEFLYKNKINIKI